MPVFSEFQKQQQAKLGKGHVGAMKSRRRRVWTENSESEANQDIELEIEVQELRKNKDTKETHFLGQVEVICEKEKSQFNKGHIEDTEVTHKGHRLKRNKVSGIVQDLEVGNKDTLQTQKRHNEDKIKTQQGHIKDTIKTHQVHDKDIEGTQRKHNAITKVTHQNHNTDTIETLEKGFSNGNYNDAKREMTSDLQILTKAVYKLKGQKLELFATLCRACQEGSLALGQIEDGGQISRITYESLSKMSEVPFGSIKTTLKRLRNEGLLSIKAETKGRGAFIDIIISNLAQELFSNFKHTYNDSEKLSSDRNAALIVPVKSE